MVPGKQLKIALIGNPNSGKTSLFNKLTGLNQKVGNFPGVTVEKISGKARLSKGTAALIVDLPGTYSLYPKSLDERVVFDTLCNKEAPDYPDLAIVVLETVNLKRGILLFTQVSDLGIPVLAVLNEMPGEKNIVVPEVDDEGLSRVLGVPLVRINARTGKGIDLLKLELLKAHQPNSVVFGEPKTIKPILEPVKAHFRLENDFLAIQYVQQHEHINFLNEADKEFLRKLVESFELDLDEIKGAETISRYQVIDRLTAGIITIQPHRENTISDKIDAVVTHKIGGYLIFLAVLFVIFQSIFSLASYPMDFIDGQITTFVAFLNGALPEGPLTSMLTEGLIAGIGGVVIFIPQIALLFVFISILEESGYMARVMFIMDKIMRRYGLNGRSVVPLISGVACAVPAIMSARTIDNWKERTITILVTPLMSCSARIPVYTILIALVVPSTYLFGMFNMQGLALMGLYLIGFFAALGSAWLMKKILKSNEKSYFIMELPDYRVPKWSNVAISVVDRVKAFVYEAGKIIVAISVVLWVLASFGPGDKMEQAEVKVRKEAVEAQWDYETVEKKVNARKLEASYAGSFGKAIEPAIAPLGFDWKIGIALITSFAAREVFVGTMSTIYSIGLDEEEVTLRKRMQGEVNPETGEPRYTLAVAFSLMIFYAFALQCMSTVAVVYREMKTWTWPLVQVVYMTGLAYLGSLIVYNLLK